MKTILQCTIHGVDRNSAITILSEIGTDMSQFKNHYRLTFLAGLASECNESFKGKKSARITKSGVYLKPYFVEVYTVLLETKQTLTM